jgi:hypothetical protein
MFIGLVCRHVARLGQPALLASHQAPQDPDDSGWLLACGQQGHEDEDWLVTDLAPYFQRDSQIATLLDSLPTGESVVRIAPESPWTPETNSGVLGDGSLIR